MKNKVEKINNVLRSVEFLIIVTLYMSIISFLLEFWSLGFVCLSGLVFLCFVYLSDQLAIIREKVIFITNVFDILLKSSGIDPDANNKSEVM